VTTVHELRKQDRILADS